MRPRFHTPLTPVQLKAEAARRLEGFQYELLVATGRIEAWHCHKPGTGDYHFDIMVTRTGMAVTGDMDGMLFNVGGFGPHAYGIPFLTHQDKRYVAEKLDSQSRRMQFDAIYFRDLITEIGAERIPEVLGVELMGEEDYRPLVEAAPWLDQDDPACPKASRAELTSWLKAAKSSGSAFTHAQREVFGGMLEAIDLSDHVDNAIEAHTFLDQEENLGEGISSSDYSLECMHEELLQRLYCLEHAARCILAIKFPEQAAA